MIEQDCNFYLTSLSILMTCLLDNVWILKGEVICSSRVGVKGLRSQVIQGKRCSKKKKKIIGTQTDNDAFSEYNNLSTFLSRIPIREMDMEMAELHVRMFA